MPLEILEDSIKARIKEPNLFDEGSFRVKDIGEGIQITVGKLIGTDQMVIQSIRFSVPPFTEETVKQWLLDHKDKFEMNDKLKSVNSVEIFSAGVWNGDKYTVDDLDGMVDAFTQTEKGFRPFLKLGHDKDQKLMQKDGFPSIGYVHNLRRVGEKLVADFKDIPSKIFDLIKNKAYSRVSSEIFWNIKYGQQTHKRMLRAVSLLGSDIPAVNNLKEIMGLYTPDDMLLNKLYSHDKQHYDKIELYDYQNNNDERDDMSKELETKLEESEKLYTQEKEKAEALETEKAEQEKKYTDLEESNKKAQEENEDLKAQVAKYDLEKKELEDKNYLNELEKDGLTSPKLNEYVVELISDKKEYSIDEKSISKKDLIKETLKLAKEVYSVNLDESSEKGKQESSDDDLGSKVEKYMKDNDCTYKSAYSVVMKQEKK